jgi:hypothetical protein
MHRLLCLWPLFYPSPWWRQGERGSSCLLEEYTKKKLNSASELYRPSDRRLSA